MSLYHSLSLESVSADLSGQYWFSFRSSSLLGHVRLFIGMISATRVRRMLKVRTKPSRDANQQTDSTFPQKRSQLEGSPAVVNHEVRLTHRARLCYDMVLALAYRQRVSCESSCKADEADLQVADVAHRNMLNRKRKAECLSASTAEPDVKRGRWSYAPTIAAPFRRARHTLLCMHKVTSTLCPQTCQRFATE